MDPTLNNVFYYILVVDDDTDDQFFLRQAISEAIPQAIIESLYDGTEAISYLDKCTALPNLIFLDLNMARLSGKATIETIRRNKALNSVPIIILTTSKNEREKQELLQLGASEFYSKPDYPKDLLRIVGEVRDKYLH